MLNMCYIYAKYVLVGNCIVELGTSLHQLINLEELNISGNNFFDACLVVNELTHLPRLKRLFVNDADYPANPICASSGPVNTN